MSMNATRQQGAALVVGLILLMLMMILGVSSVMNSIGQVQMATNAEDRSRAFQAAEFALNQAESTLLRLQAEGSIPARFVDGAGGLYPGLSAVPSGNRVLCLRAEPWRAGWDEDSSMPADSPGDAAHLSDNPRFMIGFDAVTDPASPCFSPPSAEGFSNAIGSAGSAVAFQTYRFTLTVQAAGAIPGTRVVLQEHYRLVD